MTETVPLVFALLLFAFASSATVAGFLARRRRRRACAREHALSPLTAGARHLASQVGAISRFGADLHIPSSRQSSRRSLVGVR